MNDFCGDFYKKKCWALGCKKIHADENQTRIFMRQGLVTSFIQDEYNRYAFCRQIDSYEIVNNCIYVT